MHSTERSRAARMRGADASPLGGARRRLGRGEGHALSNVELLALLLGPSRREGRLERAEALLSAGAIGDAGPGSPPAWWTRLTRAERVRVAAALELGRRFDPGEIRGHPSLRGPREVFEATADLRHQRREHFVGLYLNTRNRLLARETISVGSLNASIVHPREVFEPALRHGAASLIVVHNHPSGETDPSEDDLAITRRLTEAGELLGIPLVDHVIVGAWGFTSLKEGNRL